MLSGLRDMVAGGALKALIAGRLERYAKLDELHIESRARTLSLVVTLAGEPDPLRITTRYRLSKHDAQHFLTLEDITASRPWLEHLLTDLLAGKPLAVPAIASTALGGPHH